MSWDVYGIMNGGNGSQDEKDDTEKVATKKKPAPKKPKVTKADKEAFELGKLVGEELEKQGNGYRGYGYRSNRGYWRY